LILFSLVDPSVFWYFSQVEWNVAFLGSLIALYLAQPAALEWRDHLTKKLKDAGEPPGN
jgi:hypothetical protein